jgi:hypothetical protein
LLFLNVVSDALLEYKWPTELPGACGQTLIYERSFWEEENLPEVPIGSDSTWCLIRKPIVAEPDRVLCVATIHSRNTCRKVLKSPPYRQVGQLGDGKLLPPEIQPFLSEIRLAAGTSAP